MLDAARVGTTSQIAEAARQSHASTDYSTDAISVHIYPARILWELGIRIPSSTANRLLVHRFDDRSSIRRSYRATIHLEMSLKIRQAIVRFFIS